jgi:hypothetical protein
VVSGWRWSASLSLRTCAACLSRHGKVYPLSKVMDRHVNCRCSMSPYLGNGEDVEWESGEKWLKRQSPAVQNNILGKEGGSLFRSGDVLLSDFERVTRSSVWGDSVGDGGVAWAKRQASKRSMAARFAERKAAAEQKAMQAPAWKPSMTRAEAERWAADSALKQPYYHMTDGVNVPSLVEQGFNLQYRSFGRVWGDGVYASNSDEALSIYTREGSEQLTLRVNAQNVYHYDVSKASIGADPMSIEAIAAQHPQGSRLLNIYQELEDYRRQKQLELSMLPGGPSEARSALLKEARQRLNAETFGMADIRSKAITDWAKEQNIDAMSIENLPFNPSQLQDIGGEQLIVFDPKNVVIQVG